ncbi:MAG: hypothetical protein RR614_06075, partial [Eubacterium sp.]
YSPLVRFLSDRYPDETLSSQGQIYDYLKLYLSSDSDESFDRIRQEELSLSREVLVGIEGRQTALDMVLNEAEKMTVPGTIKILELEQLSWICRDIVYLQKLISRLKQLADKNFQIEFGFSALQNQPTFISFITSVKGIRFHKNIHKYVVNTERIQGLIPSIYLISDGCVSVGFDGDGPSVPIHTNFFSDALNVHKYSKIFDTVIQHYGNKIIVTDTSTEIDRILETIRFFSAKKEDFIYYGSNLSITTMSTELLSEILTENTIYGTARERCMLYYKNLREMMATTLPNQMGVYTLILETLEKALSYEYIIEYELSALTNRQIRKTPQQYRRHLKETVEFLENYENVNIMLLSGGYQDGVPCSWIKKNLFDMAFNTTCVPSEHQVIFWDDANLVNMAMDASNNFVKKNYSVEHRQKAYNLKVLRALSQGEII